MTAPENPPRLWACTHCAGEYISVAARLDLVEDCDEDGCVASPVAEYVLASTAAAEREAAVKAAREKFADLIEKADDLADDLVGRPRSSEVTEALRRERDALQAVVDAVAAFTAHDFAMSGAHGVMRLVRLAKDAKTAQAGKGVG